MIWNEKEINLCSNKHLHCAERFLHFYSAFYLFPPILKLIFTTSVILALTNDTRLCEARTRIPSTF